MKCLVANLKNVCEYFRAAFLRQSQIPLMSLHVLHTSTKFEVHKAILSEAMEHFLIYAAL